MPRTRSSYRWILLRTVFYIGLTVVTALFMVPLFIAILTSIRTVGDVSRLGVLAIPEQVTLQNYPTAWAQARLGSYSLVSTIITVPSLLLLLLFSSLAAYALAKLRFKGSSVMLLVIVAFMFVPPQIILIPLYRMYNVFGLVDTYVGMILIHVTIQCSFSTFLLRNFFTTIPNSLQDSARLDGCREFTIYSRIIMPLAKPPLAVLSLLMFTFIWNEFLFGLVLMTTKRPIMVGLISLQGAYNTVWTTQAAGALIASIPTIVIFLFFQRYFIEGLTVGAVKG